VLVGSLFEPGCKGSKLVAVFASSAPLFFSRWLSSRVRLAAKRRTKIRTFKLSCQVPQQLFSLSAGLAASC
ncbi:hypothetical protein, partial [Hymenobacter sp. CRA2]